MRADGASQGVERIAQPHLVVEERNLTVEVFKALADPIRLEILAHVAARGPVCVCHLEEALPYQQPRISKHLAVLRRAGLVSTRREANWVYYTAQLDALQIGQSYLDQLQASIRHPHVADSCEPAAQARSA